MPLIDITNPKVIHFLLENYEKENRQRMRWVILHQEKIQQAATFKGEVKGYTPNDINEAVMVAGLAAIMRDHVDAATHRLTAPVKDDLLAKVGTAKPPEPTMKLVPKEVHNLLHESRDKYLKARNKLASEDKYNFIESANWKYGWKLRESESKMRGPAHGRVCHMLHNMQNKVGPTPDPVHYRSPEGSRAFCDN